MKKGNTVRFIANKKIEAFNLNLPPTPSLYHRQNNIRQNNHTNAQQDYS